MAVHGMIRRVWVCLSAVLLGAAPALAQGDAPSRQIVAADYLRMQRVGDPRISPSGEQIVYELSEIDPQTDRWSTTLHIVNADGSGDRVFAKGRSARWSPDGTRIAYLGSPDGAKPAQLLVRSATTDAPPRQLTDLPEPPQDIGWSPDGRLIGFARRLPAARKLWDVNAPAPPPNAKWAQPPRQVDTIHDRLDGVGPIDVGPVHMFVVPVAGGEVRQVTSGDWTVGRILEGFAFGVRWDWLPDSSGMIVEGYSDGQQDRNFQDMTIYRVSLDGAVKRLVSAPGTWASPVVSPDGTKLAFMGHPADGHLFSMSHVYVMDLATEGPARQIATGIFWNPLISSEQKLIWSRDSRGLFYAPGLKGAANLRYAAVAETAARELTSGARYIELGNAARDGTIVALQATWEHPNEVVLLNRRGGKVAVRQLTRTNRWLDGKALATSEEIWVRSEGGPPVQGWLVKPANFDPAKKYPLILEIHGGPQTMYPSTFSLTWHVYASAGYAVLYMNPRGSIGYDDAFVHAVEHGNYPGAEFPDLMAGVDHALDKGFIDPARLYVSGCSAGGTISGWMITHTDRFAAASVRCMVSDQIVMGGDSDFPTLAFGSFDKPFWEDFQSWWDRSPLAHVQNVKTPTLIMHGGRDLRTPFAGASTFYRALKMRGVPTRMLVFDDEAHGFARPSSVIRSTLYTLAWFDHFKLGEPAELP